MSLPKPDVHILMDEDAYYFFQLFAEEEGIKPGALASRLIGEYLKTRTPRLIRIAEQLVRDRKLDVQE